MIKLGALWEKEGTKGKYFTGTITINGVEKRLVCFKNNKTKDTQPDWTINESEPQRFNENPRKVLNPSKGVYNNDLGLDRVNVSFDDDDIPF